MLTFVVELADLFDHGRVHLFAVFMTVTLAGWLVRVMLSHRYRPWTELSGVSASVLIPVVDEPLDLFRDVLRRVHEQHSGEILVVINGPRNSGLESVCDEFYGVEQVWTPQASKRNAIRLGVERATSDVIVLVDSDTLWTPNTLPELLKPFADPTVGGVTGRQGILQAERNVLTRWADWLESVRSLYSMPAQSVLGQVGCLPGRTIAFRRSILVDNMDRFMRDPFLGIHLEISDDRALTNYTLLAGYRTAYQSTSLVLTDAPTRLPKLVKQQLRWARGSQYNTLKMLPWMLRHAPALAAFYLADIALPFVLVSCFFTWGVHALTHTGMNLLQPLTNRYGLLPVMSIAVASSLITAFLRYRRHYRQRSSDLVFLPAFIMMNTLLLMPIRVAGFFRMAHPPSWGTRQGGHQASVVRLNPAAAIPYVLGTGLFVMAVLVGG